MESIASLNIEELDATAVWAVRIGEIMRNIGIVYIEIGLVHSSMGFSIAWEGHRT